MEAVVSPSALAEQVEEEDPRKLLLRWYSLSPQSYGSTPPNRQHWTFCMCCGSQFMDEQGKVGVNGTTWVAPTPTAGLDYYKGVYGPDAEARFGTAEWNMMVNRFTRFNKPGVTLSYLPLKESLERLYDSDHLALAEGYEITDKEHGTISVLWLNA